MSVGHTVVSSSLQAFRMSQGLAAYSGVFHPGPYGLVLSFRGNHLARDRLRNLKSHTNVSLSHTPQDL